MEIRNGPPEIDIEFSLRTLHRSGILGSIFTKIGTLGAYIGDIVTVYVGKTHALRKITISVWDQEHLEAVIKALEDHEAVEVIHKTDLVFERHKNGKIHSTRKQEIHTITDLRYIYTPGVARVCTAIQKDPQKAKDYTSLGHSVGIFTNGTRVLGLGDIGPVASLPVMEGKAVIYDQFVGISATPILIDSKDPDEFIKTVLKVAPSFGGIHLEDIRTPDCFYIENELKKKLAKPVMHDDQHGTGTVTLAAVMNILKITQNSHKNKVPIAQIGLGAAGFGIASLLHDWGAEIYGVDPDPQAQQQFAKHGGKIESLENAIKKAKVVITTTGVLGLIKPSMIQKGQIILSLSNPQPEIRPEEALNAGAAIAADGKTINNALAYPGLFKGALVTNAKEISSEMMIRAAEVISHYVEDNDLVPSPFHPKLHQEIVKAIEKL